MHDERIFANELIAERNEELRHIESNMAIIQGLYLEFLYKGISEIPKIKHDTVLKVKSLI